MKFFIGNSSGNVGKSTFTSILYDYIENCQVVEIETQNKGNSEVESMDVFKYKAGEDFMSVYEKIMINENVIVDVGSSNLGNFVEELQQYEGIVDIFDMFIIPTTPDDKIQTDTYKTIRMFRSFGVPDEKIKIVFNKAKGDVKKDFSDLLNTDFDFDTSLKLNESSLFKELGFLRKRIGEVYNPDINFYVQKMLKEKDREKKALNLKFDLINKMIHKINEDIYHIVESITGLKQLKKENAALDKGNTQNEEEEEF